MSDIKLFISLQKDNIDQLQECFKENIDVSKPLNVSNQMLPKILHDDASLVAVAAYYKASQCFRHLLSIIPNPLIIDKEGRSLLHFAAASGSLDIYQIAEEVINGHSPDLENSPEINIYLDFLDNSVAHYAASSGSLEILQYLWMQGQDITTLNKKDESALHWAVRAGKIDIIEFLVSSTTLTLQSLNQSNQPAFMLFPNIRTLDKCLQCGVDINETLPDGLTLLEYAVMNSKYDLAEYLLERGINTRTRGLNHFTPYEYAMNKDRRMVNLLSKYQNK